MNGTGVDRRTFLKGAGGVVLLSAGAGAALAACSSSGSPSTKNSSAAGKPVRGGNAVLAIEDVPVNMDPADGQLYSSLEVYQNIFSELIEQDADYSFHPNLASSWKQEDPKTWRFDLVQNAVFQNGEPVTAQDVKFTLDRQNTNHGLGALTSPLGEVEVISKYSCRFHLPKPYGPFEATVAAFLDIVSQKAVTSQNPKLHPVGCGPYRMTEWIQGDHVTLERWDKYFKSDRPYLDQAIFRSVGDDSVRLNGLQTGQFDWIQAVPAQQTKQLAGSSSIAHTKPGPFLPFWLSLNVTRPPFNDQRVRQAVAWAIDRKTIVDLAFFGQALAAKEFVSPPSPWYTGVDPFKGGPDLGKARALLNAAGATNLEVPLVIKSGLPIYNNVAQLIQAQLKQIGMSVSIQALGSAEYIGQVQAHKPALTLEYFSVSNDPGITYLLITTPGAVFNSSGPVSSTLRALINQFVFESDQSKRKAVNPDLVKEFAEQANYIMLVNWTQQYWTKPTFHSAPPLPTLEIRVEDMWQSGK